jgi:hypothetical protein
MFVVLLWVYIQTSYSPEYTTPTQKKSNNCNQQVIIVQKYASKSWIFHFLKLYWATLNPVHASNGPLTL